MFPQGEKRKQFMYNDLPIQISGPGQYAEHPDYEYLEGRKLDDIYPSGSFNSIGSSMMFRDMSLRVDDAKAAGQPEIVKQQRKRSIGK